MRPRQRLLDEFGPLNNWVCLDDDSDFHEHNNLVQTNFWTGLTMEHAERAIEILNRE
jgi:hypothetical protein